MSIPKEQHPSPLCTRLNTEELTAFRDLASSRGLTSGQLLRVAAREYLARLKRQAGSEADSECAAQLKASTNRICALLAKVAIDVRAIYRFLGELEDMTEQIERCRAAAAHDISRALTPAEGDAMKNMSRKVNGGQDANGG